ncbi:MAG TPA: prepilin peptidase [Syntrophorhabdaceae bacterium]|nr:prepilin peptidase [Syntrophorhabdaceae bacterium]
MGFFVKTFVFVFGAVIGSFLNVCIYRLPRSKSLVRPGSACPACDRPIRFYDNIPLISYMLLRGRCRDCGAPISIRYVVVELITAVLFFMCFRRSGLTFEFFVEIFFVALLIVVTFIDYEFQIIPDILSLGGLVAGMIFSFMRPGFRFLDGLYGILLGGGLLFVIAYGYQLITKREGMGGGDIKLLAMIGAFSGFKGVICSLVGGSVIGTIVGIPLMLIKGQGTKYAVPFGPFLSLSAVIYLFWGSRLEYMVTEILLKR